MSFAMTSLHSCAMTLSDGHPLGTCFFTFFEKMWVEGLEVRGICIKFASGQRMDIMMTGGS